MVHCMYIPTATTMRHSKEEWNIGCKSSENIETLCIMSLMAPIQIEMYYIRMYPKHLKVTIRHEKATCYVGGYYNPNPDPKADPLYPVQSKKGEGGGREGVTPCQVCPGSGDIVRVSHHGEFRQVYAKRISGVVQSIGGYIYVCPMSRF